MNEHLVSYCTCILDRNCIICIIYLVIFVFDFMISVFRALLFNHMVESHSFNVGQADNLGKKNVPLYCVKFLCLCKEQKDFK